MIVLLSQVIVPNVDGATQQAEVCQSEAHMDMPSRLSSSWLWQRRWWWCETCLGSTGWRNACYAAGRVHRHVGIDGFLAGRPGCRLSLIARRLNQKRQQDKQQTRRQSQERHRKELTFHQQALRRNAAGELP
jgi:hypothetical protein